MTKLRSRRKFLNEGLGWLVGVGAIGIASKVYLDGLKEKTKNNKNIRIEDKKNSGIETQLHIRKKQDLFVYEKKSPNYQYRDTRRIEGVIIHSTEGSGSGALNWLTSKESQVSSHYLVMEDGRIYQMVRDDDIAWHAGKNANGSYLGVEFAGYAHKQGFNFSDLQYKSGALLIKYLMNQHGLNLDKIVSHGWVSENLGGTSHNDPGENFNWVKFKEEINKNVDSDINVKRSISIGDLGVYHEK